MSLFIRKRTGDEQQDKAYTIHAPGKAAIKEPRPAGHPEEIVNQADGHCHYDEYGKPHLERLAVTTLVGVRGLPKRHGLRRRISLSVFSNPAFINVHTPILPHAPQEAV